MWRRNLLILALLILPISASAQSPTVSQVATCAGDDCVCTFASAPPASSVLVFLVGINNNTDTISVSGATSIISEPNSLNQVKVEAFWRLGDGTAAWTITTSGVGAAQAACVELTGADTSSPIDASVSEEQTGTSPTHNIDSGITTVNDNTRILAFVRSSTVADFTNGASYSDIEADNTFGGSDGQTRTAPTAGNYAVVWTSSSSELTSMLAVSIKPSAGGGGSTRCCGGLLKGVLP